MIRKIMSGVIMLVALFAANVSFAQDQKSIDDKLLQDYFAKNKIKATKTPSGLYYTITVPGKGDNAKVGQNVSMSYIGKLLDGKKFDGNVDDNFNGLPGREPFTFPLGMHRVIAGWDEGVQLFNLGSRGTLYIPSALGYGASGAGGVIPPNAVLIFDVEVKDIK